MSHPRASVRATLVTALALALLLPALAPAQVSTGSADFTRYVALGDSLTAAFASGGLIDQAQLGSYPVLIHRQALGRGGFEQPLVSPPGIPALLDLFSLRPLVVAPRSAQTGQPTNLFLPRPYDNLGVPGFKVRDVLLTTTGNPIIDLILRPSGFGNTTALQQALFLQPTFVSLWIGNNDVLGAATSGIVIDGVTLTPVAQFEADLRAIVGAVRASGANMVIANIPSVTAIPFVSTLPPVVLNPATNQPVIVNGQPVPLIGPSGPLGPGDRVLLTASAPLSQGIGIPAFLGGTGLPLGNQFVLSAAEVAAITTRTNAYNQVIGAVASEASAALVDANAIFDDIAAHGLDLGGVEYTADFLTGGIFSYDGVHPTAFGYALIANEFIAAINRQFGGNIEPVDLFPFVFGPQSAAGTLIAGGGKGAIFSAAAYESLRQGLRTPKTGWLLRQAAPGGGGAPGGPGEGGPGGPATGGPGGPVEPPTAPPERPETPGFERPGG